VKTGCPLIDFLLRFLRGFQLKEVLVFRTP